MKENHFDPETYEIIGAAMEVHRLLGPRLMEKAYHRALARELGMRGIPYTTEVEVPLIYKGEELGVPFRADFVCGDVILEIKAIPCLGPEEYRQLSHYVVSTQSRAGLLLNFGTPSLGFERFDLK